MMYLDWVSHPGETCMLENHPVLNSGMGCVTFVMLVQVTRAC